MESDKEPVTDTSEKIRDSASVTSQDSHNDFEETKAYTNGTKGDTVSKITHLREQQELIKEQQNLEIDQAREELTLAHVKHEAEMNILRNKLHVAKEMQRLEMERAQFEIELKKELAHTETGIVHSTPGGRTLSGFERPPPTNPPDHSPKRDTRPSRLSWEPSRIADTGDGQQSETATLTDILQQMLNNSMVCQQSLVDSLNIPRNELPIFDGDPLKYWPFIRAFQNTVGDKSTDDASKLTCLLQYCTGRAKRLLQCCLIKEPSEGYKLALKLLEERFGNNFMIAQEWIKKILNRSEVKVTSDLRDFADDLRCCQETLVSMGFCAELDNSHSMLAIVEKLPYHLRTRWLRENHNIKSKYQRNSKLTDLVEFITLAADEASDPVFGKAVFKDKVKDVKENSKPTDRRKSAPRHAGSFAIQSTEAGASDNANMNASQSCPQCNQHHFITQCPTFKALRIKDRISFVRSKNLCVNCFKSGHIGRDCARPFRCTVENCGQKHSKFLHIPVREQSQAPMSAQAPPVSSPPVANNTSTPSSNFVCANEGKVALPIVPARVRGPGMDQFIDTYALLDPGTNGTYCTQFLQQSLGISGNTRHSELTTIAQANIPIISTVISLQVSDVNDAITPIIIPEVTVRPNLNIDLTGMARQVELECWPHLRDIPISDIDVDKVHLLIGQDSSDLLVPEEIRRGKIGEPFAIRTPLGWALNGPMKPGKQGKNAFFIQHETFKTDFERLWALEDANSDDVGFSVDDRKVIKIWDQSGHHDGTRYSFDIPFKSRPPELPGNLNVAKHRLRLLGNQLKRDPSKHLKYTDEIHKLLDKGHAEIVTSENTDAPVWYLPHQSVQNPKKPGKFRLVHDCAAKCKGISLNDNVYQGPVLTNKLVGVLLRFRQDPVAFMADIESMFMQIKVTLEDRDMLRFLWWKGDDPNNDIITLRMTRHLFGGTWSPSCATYALHKTAKDHEMEYPADVIDTVINNFYVDDCLKSVESLEDASRLAAQVKEILTKGGFRLTKFVSNSRELLDTIPQEDLVKGLKSLDLHLDDLPCERALGLLWDIETDCFKFDTGIEPKPKTRRGILSTLSTVYDPLGFVSPYVFKARQIFQHLCRLKYGWDDPLPHEILEQWGRWLEDLPLIEHINIPRCLRPEGFNTAQLHHFSDASELGYGAASYLLLVNKQGETHSSLVMAKARLAPLKSSTIPRLELAGALESVKLDRLLRKELEFTLEESIFWTDSTIVLWYIQNNHKRFLTYVANRVAKIREHTEPHQWCHVPSNLNPGDDASRGLSAADLTNNIRWLQGPEFLTGERDAWPVQPTLQCSDLDTQVELKMNPKIYAFKQEAENPTNLFLSRFSSWYRSKRAVAWILKYRKFLLKQPIDSKLLSVDDLHEAELSIITFVQQVTFTGTSKMKDLARLSPKYDPSGILRVGGRLTNAPLPDDKKHPVLLPSTHHISELIVRHYHEITGHSGVERTHFETRQRFWIVAGRTIVRKVVFQCIPCKRLRAPTETQLMGNLPEARVTPNEPPFSRVGVDYFGPFIIKRARSEVKRYGCIFTCFTTRAVHIEIAQSLDTDSFINALQRFMARRGEPIEIYSDNGTNFVGAQQELRRSIKEWNQGCISDFLLKKEIVWKFNPPAASHMGGVWERHIRSIRSVLQGLLGQQKLDEEGLTTLMTIVESIINGRPITKLSNDPNDPTPLTPNHLLLLRSGPILPPGQFVERDLYRRRWRQVQYLADVFWTRWTHEYLPTLQERQKWLMPHRNLRAGDLVLVKHDNTVRNKWPLGLIVETYPGADGLVRSVSVRTTTGVYDRPVTKICLLEGSVMEPN